MLNATQPLSEVDPGNRPLLFDGKLEPKPAYAAVAETLAAVPEPSTGLLTIAGLLALALRARAA